MRFMERSRYTEEQGRKLGLVGWVKNTAHGTVIGQLQGPKEKVEIMKNWLRTVGSPMSRIDRAVFSNEKEITCLEFQSFTTKY
ncbi:acylphosphatase-2 isoform X2 [Anolis carolinensis]|uniref:acylphosphatase-2 isoform X2 n=1 Tax=Anolis carolinensis TaxID=28377 RepID=UPI002F2B55DF